MKHQTNNPATKKYQKSKMDKNNDLVDEHSTINQENLEETQISQNSQKSVAVNDENTSVIDHTASDPKNIASKTMAPKAIEADNSLKAEQLTTSAESSSFNPLWLLAGIPVVGLGLAMAGGGSSSSSSQTTTKPKTDSLADKPNNNGSSDKPNNDDSSDQPNNDGSSDKPNNNGSSDQPNDNGSRDQPNNDGSSDQPNNDGSSDQPNASAENTTNNAKINLPATIELPNEIPTNKYTTDPTESGNNRVFEANKSYNIELVDDLTGFVVDHSNSTKADYVKLIDLPISRESVFNLNLGGGDNFINANSQTIDNFNITTKDGNDTLAKADNITNSKINLGDGNNIITTVGGSESSVFTTGNGNDKIKIQAGVIKSEFNLGGSDDEISIFSSDATSKINLGSGDDKLFLTNAYRGEKFKSDGIFDGGDGIDTIFIRNTEVHSKNLNNFEKIVLQKDSSLILDNNSNNLAISQDKDTHSEIAISVKIGSGWTKSDQATDGFYSYTHENHTIQIQDGIMTTII